MESILDELRAALKERTAAVLTAPPGAGKTTVAPLRLLDDYERIVLLEPRRVVTRAAARRMASLLGEEVGGTVGFRTRDDRRVSAQTRIEVVTEGILTRRLLRDPTLPGTDLVIFDEFHERNVHADVALALLLATARRAHVLVMSATLDVNRIARLLDDAPIVRSEGRMHPVDIRWLPRVAVEDAIERALREEHGDVLAFLPGAGEIHRAIDGLGGRAQAELVPLYGALSAADQDRALRPSSNRRVILATDIAETSLTVEGVRVVVDSGLARVPRFDVGSGMTRLKTIPASKASTDQRAGRAGRVEPGVAYRLWSKTEHAARRPQIDPEITQVDLAQTALDLATWQQANEPRWLDPPPPRALRQARQLLGALDALDGDGRPTALGRAMGDLPLHPRLARMVTQAQTWTACVLAALLEERDIMRGRVDDLPASILHRVVLVPTSRRTNERARDIARRAHVDSGEVDMNAVGPTLALAYPDRIARNRHGTTPGQFKLADGSAAWVRPHDDLAHEPVIVIADTDGNKRSARIRMAAPIRA